MRVPRRQRLPDPGGKTAAKYHTARFMLVPALRDELAVPVPADRRARPDLAASGPALDRGRRRQDERGADPDRLRPLLHGHPGAGQPARRARSRAGCQRVFSEKISTRVKVRPELEKALTLAHEIKQAAPATSR